MKSIAGKLLLGLVVSGIIGGAVLAVLVTYQYGLLSKNPPPLSRTIQEITEHVLIPVGVFLFLFGTGALLVIRRVEAQLKSTARDVCQAAQELRSYQTPGDALPTELKPFTDAVNVLTARLEAHARRQEAFAADAAHELKTPLAILALSLDKLPVEEASPLRTQVHALSDMVDQLLLLARSNTPDLTQRRSIIEPGALARRIGLASDDLERLKARGIRADRAPGGAAGLGLAIADRIAEAHGGELATCLPDCAGLSLQFPELPAS